MNKQELFDKYDIVEGFIPLKDTVVYAIELKKLNIKIFSKNHYLPFNEAKKISNFKY